MIMTLTAFMFPIDFASRCFCNILLKAGKDSAAITAIMAMTTKISTKLNPLEDAWRRSGRTTRSFASMDVLRGDAVFECGPTVMQRPRKKRGAVSGSC